MNQTSTRLSNVCPECGSEHLVRDENAGEIICQGCGLVIQDTILDEGPEWRAFTPEQRKARRRTGPRTSLSIYDKGLSTNISIGKDTSGHRLRTADRIKMRRLRRWNIRARLRSTALRNLSRAMIVLDKLCDKLNIPESLKESAALIYRRALKEDLVRGRSIAAIAAASLYLALRRADVARTLKEICEVSMRSKKEISRCYRLIFWKLGYKTPIDDPILYVSKIGFKAGISQRAQVKAIKLLNKAKRMQVSVGKDPSGLAAAALYISCQRIGEKTTQRTLAEASGVTEVTVRNRYKGLIKDMKLKIEELKSS